MKINSIKLTVVIILSTMVSAVSFGLFFIEIPEGNRDAAVFVLGSMATVLVTAITDLFKKGV